MEFFIDTADVGEIKKALALGVCDGVTRGRSRRR
jgi:transaldolase